MTPAERSFALALCSACSRNGTLPPEDVLHWLVSGIAGALRDGTSIDAALGMSEGRRSMVGAARKVSRSAYLLAAADHLSGSARAKAAEIVRRMARLQRGNVLADDCDRLLVEVLRFGGGLTQETVRKVLAGSKTAIPNTHDTP